MYFGYIMSFIGDHPSDPGQAQFKSHKVDWEKFCDESGKVFASASFRGSKVTVILNGDFNTKRQIEKSLAKAIHLARALGVSSLTLVDDQVVINDTHIIIPKADVEATLREMREELSIEYSKNPSSHSASEIEKITRCINTVFAPNVPPRPSYYPPARSTQATLDG